MRIALPLLAAVIALPATGALAKDRPITDQERPKLEAALKEAGCSGGKIEFDDDKAAAHPNGKFEVDDFDLPGRQEVRPYVRSELQAVDQKARLTTLLRSGRRLQLWISNARHPDKACTSW